MDDAEYVRRAACSRRTDDAEYVRRAACPRRTDDAEYVRRAACPRRTDDAGYVRRAVVMPMKNPECKLRLRFRSRESEIFHSSDTDY